MTRRSRSSGGRTPRAKDSPHSKPPRDDFNRVSFDLIYALPGDTEKSWAVTLAGHLTLGTTAPVAIPADNRAGYTICTWSPGANSSRSTPTPPRNSMK